jgi:heat shock protein HtpX
MKNIKTILLFLFTNIVIIAVLNVLLYIASVVFWFDIYSSSSSIVNISMIAFVFGFGWAFVNLLISKRSAKKIYKIKLISVDALGKEKVVYDTIALLAAKYKIKNPEAGIYDSPDPNAFATWPSKNNSIIAVSTWLLESLTDEELKGVIGHEFAHIINGDMVKMTLLQWIINTFVMFLSRIIAYGIDLAMKKDDNEWWFGGIVYFILVFVLDILLWFVGMLILMSYSRKREYRADEWSSKLLGKDYMIKALEKLQHLTSKRWDHAQHDEFSSLKIIWSKDILRLFSSHPTLESRLQHLKKLV